MKRLILLATIAILALIPQANASALIADCTMKANTAVMAAPGDKQPSWTAKEDTRAYIYELKGNWASFGNDDNQEGWAPRASMVKCTIIKPWVWKKK